MRKLYVRVSRKNWMPIGYIDLDGRGKRKGGPVFLDHQIRERIKTATKLTKQIRGIEKKHGLFEGVWWGRAGRDAVRLKKIQEERDRRGPLALLERRAVSVATRGPRYVFPLRKHRDRHTPPPRSGG